MLSSIWRTLPVVKHGWSLAVLIAIIHHPKTMWWPHKLTTFMLTLLMMMRMLWVMLARMMVHIRWRWSSIKMHLRIKATMWRHHIKGRWSTAIKMAHHFMWWTMGTSRTMMRTSS